MKRSGYLKKHILAKIIQTRKSSTLLIFGECEIPKPNVLLSSNTIQQDLFKEDWIISSYPINYKRLLKTPDILVAFTSGHSPSIFTLIINHDEATGKSLWKFNNSLVLNSDFVKRSKLI